MMTPERLLTEAPMDAHKMFRTLVLGGASLTLGAVSCGTAGYSGNSDSGTGQDAATYQGDAGAGTDAGCSCHPDSMGWPGNDCAPTGGTFVCCWLHPSAPCCS